MVRVNVTRIQHVSVNCEGRLAETRDFYEQVFGLATAERPDLGIDGHWFAAGDAQVHLIDARARGEGIDPIGPHWCFFVTDLDGAEAELADAGVEHFRLGAQLFLVDPAGNTVELQQEAG